MDLMRGRDPIPDERGLSRLREEKRTRINLAVRGATNSGVDEDFTGRLSPGSLEKCSRWVAGEWRVGPVIIIITYAEPTAPLNPCTVGPSPEAISSLQQQSVEGRPSMIPLWLCGLPRRPAIGVLGAARPLERSLGKAELGHFAGSSC